MATSFTGYRALGNINPATGAFTEIAGGSYARQSVTLQIDPDGRVTNSADITYPAATTAAWPTFSAVAIYDASTAGNLVLWYETGIKNVVAVGVSHVVSASRTKLTFPVGGFTNHGTPIHLGKDINVSGKTILVAGV